MVSSFGHHTQKHAEQSLLALFVPCAPGLKNLFGGMYESSNSLPDHLRMCPADPENQTQLINEAAKQTLVMTQDSDAPKSDRAFYVGTDNVAAGRQAGGLIKEALPQGGKIMIFVGKLDVRNAQERYQGIKEAVQGSNVEIIDVRTDDTDQVRAKSNVADTLVKYPEVKALVGLWSYNGPAILSAVRDANKIGQVKIIAFDEED